MSGRTRPDRYLWLDRLVSAPPEVDSYSRAVGLSLWTHFNTDGVCWPSLRLIEIEARVSRNTVLRSVAKLEDAGLLRVEHRKRGVNRYHALLPSGSWGEPDTDGTSGSRKRRSGSPAPISGSRDELSGSREPSSGSPGEPEQWNSEAVEHVNRGAQSGGATDVAPALGAEEIAKVQISINTALEYIHAYDDELYAVCEKIGREEPPLDMLVSEAFSRRLTQAGVYETHDFELRLRPNLTRGQATAAKEICGSVLAWRIDTNSPPEPGWAKNTIKRRERYIAEATNDLSVEEGAPLI